MWVRIPPRAFILRWRIRRAKEIVPELPEVQILVSQLARRLERGRIRAVEVAMRRSNCVQSWWGGGCSRVSAGGQEHHLRFVGRVAYSGAFADDGLV